VEQELIFVENIRGNEFFFFAEAMESLDVQWERAAIVNTCYLSPFNNR